MNIAIIPARGGSKRIARKNIKMFDGIPMIAHAIRAARKSALFDYVMVSTDDAEISQVALQFGAEVPFVRPVELANDHTPTVPVVAHAIDSCRSLGLSFEYVCCIYPAVPFLLKEDLKGALQLLQDSRADYSFPVTEFPSAIQRALARNSDSTMRPLYPQYETTRTQDLEPTFYDAGQFYWGRAETWGRNMHLHSGSAGYVIPNWRVIDIDTLDDWRRAELMFQALCKSNAAGC